MLGSWGMGSCCAGGRERDSGVVICMECDFRCRLCSIPSVVCVFSVTNAVGFLNRARCKTRESPCSLIFCIIVSLSLGIIFFHNENPFEWEHISADCGVDLAAIFCSKSLQGLRVLKHQK